MESPPPWSELPQELLGLLIAPDRARFRAVCRSWHSAMRRERVPQDLFPWIVLADATPFVTSTDGSSPAENMRCIGSTNDWIVLDSTQDDGSHTYSLYNPFTGADVALPELNNAIGNASKAFRVSKVLMRSTPDDVIAFMTNNWNHPLILVRPGKGLWLPEPRTTPFVSIIDVAFLRDKLYGITRAGNDTPLDIHAIGLVSLDVAFDGEGVPVVSNVKRVIKIDNESDDEWGGVIENDDVESEDDEVEEFASDDEISDDDGDEQSRKTGDGMILEAMHWDVDQEVHGEPKDRIATMWYFMESRGNKTIMVRRRLQLPYYAMTFTLNVEAFEVDISAGTWVPVSDSLCGEAIFISKPFCRSMLASGEIREDTIYFIDSGDMFDMRSKTISPPNSLIDFRSSTWTFPTELVV